MSKVQLKTERHFEIALMTTSKAYGHCSNLETGKTAAGVFDLNFADDESGKDYWFELKYWSPKRYPDIRASQLKWGKERWRISKNCFLLTCVEVSAGEEYMLMMHSFPHMTDLRDIRDKAEWRRRSIFDYHMTGEKVPQGFFDQVITAARRITNDVQE